MNHITLEQAQAIIYDCAHTLGMEEVSIYDACGRILGRDLVSAMDQPPFPRSAMDGYALASSDSVGASPRQPVELPVVYKACAGDAPGRAIVPGEAVRIMTGAAVPEGADCVVRQEDTDSGEAVVRIFAPAKPWQNRCPVGEDFQAGQLLLPKGARFDSYAIAVAVAGGQDRVAVYRRPRVLIVSTGDELCPVGRPLGPGQIYNSNMAYLLTRCKQLGWEILSAAWVGDDLDAICGAIAGNVEGSDLILTTGGVSVGQKDLLPAAMERLGADILFHGVALKPGMPTMASLVEGTPVLSLSGNPFAAIVLFELLAGPFLAKCHGVPFTPRRQRAAVSGGFPKKSPARRMVRGRLEGTAVRILPEQGNGQLLSGIGTNCLADIPAGSGPLAEGDEVDTILLEGY